MAIKNPVLFLLAALAYGGPALAEQATPAAESGCHEVKAYQRYKRPTHFTIERNEQGFEYKCVLRKNKYRKKDPAVFRGECEAFVNEYIDRLNSCEHTDVPRFILDPSREQLEKQESKGFLNYKGFVEVG